MMCGFWDVWMVDNCEGVLVRCFMLLVLFWCEVVCLVVLWSRVCLLQYYLDWFVELERCL